ncbi:MAG TPA: serine/threonine-protein kinase [Kofleriaceae bacterium]|nr:serine/threonine-protein kinase [Kofleriaceae bacterium]
MGARFRDHQPSGTEPTQIAAADATLPAASGSGTVVLGPGAIDDDLHPGQTLGRYRIERLVGRGGMGEVYAAHDPQLDRRVAIKVLTATYRSSEAAGRLVREAQALAKLDHPNVVAVHDAGEVDGRVFLAMGFVEGVTLGEHIARERLPWNEVVALFVAAGRGLAAAHGAGLVHRDFKPGNVLVDRQGRVAVTDFGLARGASELSTHSMDGGFPMHTPDPSAHPSGHHSHSSLDSNMTQAGALIGTPAYMSPEQHSGERGSPRSDQFSFCVALWEALFGRHPFVPAGHDKVTSPFEYTHLITTGELAMPGAGTPVTRRVQAALARGLQRAPDRRWPSMTVLLDELEPPPASYRTAIIGLAAVATAGVGVAVWLAVKPHDAGRTCAVEASDRVATAWNAEQAKAVTARFAASGRPYAPAMASEAIIGLDRYAQRWSQLAAEGCTTGAGGDAAGREIAVRRAACLDQRLTALRTVVGQLTVEGRAELVDNAQAVVAGLPDLGDCADARALAAGGGPPPDVAAKLPALQTRLAELRVLVDAGLFRDALAPAETLVTEADAVGWPTVRVGAHQALGEVYQGLYMPEALDETLAAATIATEARLDREAARAYALAVVAAGTSRRKDALTSLAPVARAVAAATGDPLLVARAKLAHGRALTRASVYAEAEQLCREADAVISTHPDATRGDRAEPRKCLIEALIPLDKRKEAREVIETALAEVKEKAGPDHPAVADLETTLAGFLREDGKVDEARAMIERGLALREKAYGAEHVRVAESLIALADYEPDEARRGVLLERALAIAEDPAKSGIRGKAVAAQIHRRLALTAGRHDDNDGTRKHFERELELLEEYAGPDSLEVAILLVNYGQYATRWDMDAGIAMLRRSADILDRLKDPRAAIARGGLGVILVNAEKWQEALPILERNVREADPDRIPPQNFGQMHYHLAIALIETKGDRARAAKLADTAHEAFVRAGPDGAELIERLDRWRRVNRLEPASGGG